MSFILSLKNVSFCYPGSQKKVLSDVNIDLEAGKKYALIGPTGEGKSTLAMLMAGLVKPTEGQILYEDQDLQLYSRGQIADSLGFILQDPFLFAGTVKENILYGGDLDEEKLVELLAQKDLKNLIDRFPDGLETVVTNNSENISLGQKQIINFLRVILRQPRFLILDEATANLDTITESYLQQILNNLPKETTMVIIAHRLNTVKNVDVKFQVGGGKVKVLE
jgi:ATP-binding cassette, subfamily B, bacterial